MQGHGPQAHRVGRLDSDDPVAHIREPGRIAPGTGTDVENAARSLRDQVQNSSMHLQSSKAFITLEKLFRLFRVALEAAPVPCPGVRRDHRLWHPYNAELDETVGARRRQAARCSGLS
jgi:hypothetical protein